VLIPDLASTIGALKSWRAHWAPAEAVHAALGDR